MIDIFHQKYLYLAYKKSIQKNLLREFTKQLPVSLWHSQRVDLLSRFPELNKKMAHYGYGWYTQEQLEDYYDQLIGNFFNTINIFRIIC